MYNKNSKVYHEIPSYFCIKHAKRSLGIDYFQSWVLSRTFPIGKFIHNIKIVEKKTFSLKKWDINSSVSFRVYVLLIKRRMKTTKGWFCLIFIK